MYLRIVINRSSLWILLYVLCVFTCTSITSTLSCYQQRTVFRNISGVISDGRGKYPEGAECEWLITAPHKNQTISLTFSEFETECSYDFLFIYDGGSYSSPLLASFSGNQKPDKVISSSNEMLIFLYSDKNYALGGFKVTYTINYCQDACSNMGVCTNGKCVCTAGSGGDYCENRWCPKGCSSSENKGRCDLINQRCVCNSGFYGESCSMSTSTETGFNEWHVVSSTSKTFAPRAGHLAFYVEDTDSLWIHGGYSFHDVLSDLVMLNVTTGQWSKLTLQGSVPSGRYYHAGSVYKENLVIYGGEVKADALSNEFWIFNTNSRVWRQLVVNGSQNPPALAGHTATVVDDYIFLIGGRTIDDNYSANVYKFNLKTETSWERVVSRRVNKYDLRIVGHSTVFDKESRTLIVFGGLKPVWYSKQSRAMNQILAYHVDENVWNKWYPQQPDFHPLPKPQAYHTANIVGDYMIVYGGLTSDDTCYLQSVLYYNLKCHFWVKTAGVEYLSPVTTSKQRPPRGRYAHAAVVKSDLSIIVAGGFSGIFHGDVLAFKVPLAVASKKNSSGITSGQHCKKYQEKNSCFDDPACGWCFGDLTCYDMESASLCKSTWVGEYCPGPCKIHSQCEACVSWPGKNKCGWCVQDGQCYPTLRPGGMCSSAPSLNKGGWWGANTSLIFDLGRCQTADHKPGLTYLVYYHPEKVEHPDYVTVVSTPKVAIPSLNDGVIYSGKTVIIKGFLFPYLFNLDPSKAVRRVYLEGTLVSATLYLSDGNAPSRKQLVATISESSSLQEMEAVRTDGRPLFPTPTPSSSYYLECIGNATYHTARLLLEWNLTTTAALTREVIQTPYIQPFYTSNCSVYANCMACVADSHCGWCPSSFSCTARGNWKSCVQGEVSVLLIRNQSHCFLCQHHYNCGSCVQDKNCGWNLGSSMCFRRGLGAVTVTAVDKCPSSCLRRTDCGSCIAEGDCTWCHSQRICFPLSQYLDRFSFGQCSTWADKTGDNHKCHNCSQYMTCSSCLSDHKCGWCANANNPLIGRCYSGDFAGPSSPSNCSTLLKGSSSASWSYSKCPDVDECRLGIHNCNSNASCFNTYGSFVCRCNRGFTGDGVSFCKKTCYHECVHGYCGSDYHCKCNLGWVGVNCSTDCGCNGHSTCLRGIGKCDQCHNHTTGKFCEQCSEGCFGDASLPSGCQPCKCNGHGDKTRGTCDSKTGKCFCRDDTRGDECQKCLEGLTGDPRNNGFCFHRCQPYSVVLNKTSGTISSASGPGISNNYVYCKWLISGHGNTSHDIVFRRSSEDFTVVAVAVTFTHLRASCFNSHIDVYDGTPPNPRGMQSEVSNTLKHIGVACGYNAAYMPQFVAASGNLVITYTGLKGPLPKGSFVASFRVIRCPKSCVTNGKCNVNNQGKLECLCNDGWSGVHCDREICPLNCSHSLGQGSCSKSQQMCICTGLWTGRACNYSLPSAFLSWSRLPAVSSDGKIPQPRYGHTLVYYPKENSFVLFGGVTQEHKALKDTWKFSLSTNTWTEIKASGHQSPTARYYHCAAVIKDTLVIFGGNSGETQLSDFWILHLASLTWNKVSTQNSPNLMGQSCTTVTSSMYVIGGYSASHGLYEALLKFDITTLTWTVVKGNGFGPSGIFSHSAVYYEVDQTIFVFGGVAFYGEKVQESNRLYSYHVPTSTWNLLETPYATKPPSLILHSSVILQDVLYVTGGYSGKNNLGFNNKIVTLNLKCMQWGLLGTSGRPELDDYQPGFGVGLSSATDGKHVYSFGGRHGATHGHLWKLSPPSTFCAYMRSKADCIGRLGCTWCSYVLKQTMQVTGVCFATVGSIPAECTEAQSINISKITANSCVRSALQSRSCSTSTSCVSCLATFPGFSGPQCNWCQCRQNSTCIGKNEACKDCNTKIDSLNKCLETSCEASSCENCIVSGQCMWTRHFLYESELLRIFSKLPTSPWNCFTIGLEKLIRFPITDKVPPHTCPKRCASFKDCSTCLAAPGADGGTTSCVWSSKLSQCLSKSAIPLMCIDGLCGLLYEGEGKCPKPCSAYSKCSACLQKPGCGWCAVDNIMGEGQCVEGDLIGSVKGNCGVASLEPGKPLVYTVGQNSSVNGSLSRTSIWASLICPLENECLNGRHNCKTYEHCVDLPEGFLCRCLTGYEKDPTGTSCRPICSNACIHGTCVLPEQCKCEFGWTGANCSVRCQCNGHSDCPNETLVDVCLKCRDNTQGASCNECQPFYVGKPINGGKCEPCSTFCNGKTKVCLNRSQYESLPTAQKTAQEIAKLLTKGSTDPSETVCVDCEGHSEGNRCDTCKDGYFLRNESCTRCQCNGHWNTCDKKTGGGCKCQHNTETDKCTSDCWLKQCSKCVDGYIGDPVNGQQCYKKLSTPETVIIGVDSHPLGGKRMIKGIPSNRTVFIATLPKFTNVDIRITVDIFEGAVDLYISVSDTAFVVEVDFVTGAQIVKTQVSKRNKRSVADFESIDVSKKQEDVDHHKSYRLKRSTDTEPSAQVKTHAIDTSDRRLSSFVSYRGGILKVSGIYKRTVITVPYGDHDFRHVKLYSAVVTTGSDASHLTSGVIYSRQDLSKIDLFVFFSVFFSIFFLILSTFVLVWKGKQAYGARVAARTHQQELETMESRPFASYTMRIERNEDVEHYKKRRTALSHSNTKNKKSGCKDSTVVPMAVEQTEDGLAAVVTVLVQFPENELSPWNFVLGSALATSTAQQLVNVTCAAQTANGRKYNTRILSTTT